MNKLLGRVDRVYCKVTNCLWEEHVLCQFGMFINKHQQQNVAPIYGVYFQLGSWYGMRRLRKLKYGSGFNLDLEGSEVI